MTEESIDTERMMKGEDMGLPKQCGTCKWWDKYGRSMVGKCTFPLPISARQDNTMSMLYWQGQRCPVWSKTVTTRIME